MPLSVASQRRRVIPNTFVDLIEQLIAEEGTASRVAENIQMSLSAFRRGTKQCQTLSTENCLRLAEAYELNPTDVLRLARKTDVANRIERLYGKPNPHALSSADRTLLHRWDQLTHEGRRALEALLDALLGARKGR